MPNILSAWQRGRTVTALGDPKSAPRRLNLAQSFNGLGAFIAAMFLSKLILSGNHYTRK